MVATSINDTPQIDTDFQNMTIGDKTTIRLDINISDFDGDSLTLNIESSSSILTIDKNFTNPILLSDYANSALYFYIISDDNATGSAKVTLILSDGDSSVSKSFIVNITKEFKSGDRWRGLVYKTVTSPYTSRVWLDRNLGAKRACQTSSDADCYGDYYQWGRETDGHEKNSSSTTTTIASDIANAGDKFIKAFATDWLNNDGNRSKRTANWNKTGGSSICPIGFRVPTDLELRAETINYNIPNINDIAVNDIFDNFLKLGLTGYRSGLFGSMNDIGRSGYLWSNTTIDRGGVNTSHQPYYLYFVRDHIYINPINVSYGVPVRCIKAD